MREARTRLVLCLGFRVRVWVKWLVFRVLFPGWLRFLLLPALFLGSNLRSCSVFPVF